MSPPIPLPPEAPFVRNGSRTAVPGIDEGRLRGALATAGLSESRVDRVIAVLREDPGAGGAPPEGTERFRTLADITPQLIWHAAGEGHWIWAAPSWLAYTGQGQGECRGRGWLDAIHPEDRDATMRAWREAPERGSIDVEHRVRRVLDGAWRMHRTRAAPLRQGSGGQPGPAAAAEWVGASTDVEDVRRMEDEQHALLLELQHRTRNLLALVQVIAHRSLSPAPERSAFSARLASLGRVQGFLARDATWSVPLRDLVEAELRALAEDGAGRARVTGPRVDLPGEVVQPIALALHELASNAARHGAMAQRGGHLVVTWRLEGVERGVRLVIEWRESGVVMPSGPLARRFGCRVIERTVPHQLHGEARLEPGKDGIHCQLSMPLPRGAGAGGRAWTGSGHTGRPAG